MLLLDILVFTAWVVSCSAVVGMATYAAGYAAGLAIGGPTFWRPRPASRPVVRPSRHGLLLESRR